MESREGIVHGMGKIKDGKLVIFSVSIPRELLEHVARYKHEHGGSRSDIIREALLQFLDADSRTMEANGYQDGLRRGIHEARTAIRDALTELWEKPPD